MLLTITKLQFRAFVSIQMFFFSKQK